MVRSRVASGRSGTTRIRSRRRRGVGSPPTLFVETQGGGGRKLRLGMRSRATARGKWAENSLQPPAPSGIIKSSCLARCRCRTRLLPSRGMPMSVRTLLSAAVCLALSGSLPAAEPDPKKDPNAPVSFYREIRPIFVQHCQGCHQPAKQSGSFVMTSYAELLKGGDHDEPGVVPGKPDKSYIVEQITVNPEGKAEMPRNKDPLPKKDIDLIVLC